MNRPRAALLALLAAGIGAASVATIAAGPTAHTAPAVSHADPTRLALDLPATPPADPLASLPADPCALGVDQLEAAGMSEADALARRTPCHPADDAPAMDNDPAPADVTAAAPSSPASSSHRTTSTRSPAAPAPAPAVLSQPAPNGTELQGPSMCTDPTDCPTGDQLDSERIGRVIDTPDGRRCTVVAVNPDRLECTPEP